MALQLSTLSAKDAITAIYVGYYDRAPDPAGLSYWIGRYNEFRDGAADGDAGMNLAQIAASFSVQPETTQEYPFFTSPNVANATVFITQIYLNLFNRVPDQDGLDYWVGQLQSNPDQVGQIIINIISGAQDNGPGFNDRSTVLNKIEVAADWATDAADAGVDTVPFTSTTEPEAFASATNILDGVTDDDATVTAAMAETDAFIAAYLNTAPVAPNAFETVNEDELLTDSIVASDVDGDTLTYTVEPGDGPSNGTVSMNSDGTYTYDSNEDFFGTDSFVYTVSDGKGGTDTGTITVTVASVNDDPIAVGAAASTNEDAPVTAAVGASDTEDAAVDLVYAVATNASNGSVTMNPNGTYTYTPNLNFNGTDTFTYRVTDTDGGTDTATVTVTVAPVNDAPTAAVLSQTVLEDGSINIDVSGVTNDVDGDALTTSIATQAANGTVTLNANGTFTYVPDPNYNGADSFQYTVTDPSGASATSTVSLVVTSVNDAPVGQVGAISVVEDTVANGTVTATDVDGDTLNFAYNGDANKGAVVMTANGSFTYTPNANATGSDSFTYSVTDGTVTTTQTVTVSITPVNDAPAGVVPVSYNTNEDTDIVGGTLPVATDVDGDTLTYGLGVQAANGIAAVTANGGFSYDPNLNFNGTDTFTYTVTDGTVTLTETVTIFVAPVNDPVNATDSTLDTFEDVPESASVSATDVDGDVLVYSVATQPTNGAGTVAMNADGTYTFTPADDFNGTATFTFSVTDNNGSTDTGTVTINVAPVDDVLTPGIDDVNGGQGDDVVIGNENTLNPGDQIDGGTGDDTLLILTTGEATFNGFSVTNVENIVITAEDDEGNGNDTTIVDASGINGATSYTSLNSRGDLDLDFVNGIAMGSNFEFNMILDNLTNDTANGNGNSSIDFDARASDTTGAADYVNLLVTNSQTSGRDVGNVTIDGAIEIINLNVTDSTGIIRIDDLDVSGDGPGATTLNIDSDVTVQIGDTTEASNVAVYDNGGLGFFGGDVILAPTPGALFPTPNVGLVQGPSTSPTVQSNATLAGFNNEIASSITQITVTGDGGAQLSADNATSGVTFTGSDVGQDVFEGSDNGDVINGRGGNDILDGEDGNDVILGGSGNDFLIGDDGNDTVSGEDGNDTLLGGDGSDDLFGGSGDDVIDTGDSGDNSTELVDGGIGSDTVWTRGEQLLGRAFVGENSSYDVLRGGQDDAGAPDAAENDVLNIVGDSADVDGLNDVSEFECINLIDGTFSYTIGAGSTFESYNDTATVNDMIVINGTEAGSAININASTLVRGIAIVGGDSNDSVIGGGGDDIIVGDGDTGANDGGNDTLRGNGGADTFIFDGRELTTGDVVDGGAGSDTILIEVRNGTATLGSGISNVETVRVAESANEVTQKVSGLSSTPFEGDQTISIDAAFVNGGVVQTLIDGSIMDADDRLTVDHDNGSTAQVQILGGAANDTFYFGTNLDSGDVINGGGDSGVDTLTDDKPVGSFDTNNSGDVLVLSSGTYTGADFAGLTGVEIIKLAPNFTGSVTLDANSGAGIQVIDGRDAQSFTLNAATYGSALTIFDGYESDDITGTAFGDTIVMQGDSYDDTISAGGGDDVIKVSNFSMDGFGDQIDGGAGINTIELQNETLNEDINVDVNLDIVTNIQRYTLQGDGNTFPWYLSNAANDHVITFQGGNVGSVTDIEIDGTGGEAADSLTVVIDGDGAPGGVPDVDGDFRFTFTGTEGDDTLVKNNVGINNNIDFQGGNGNDVFRVAGGDLGASTIFNGGAGTDAVDQMGGVFIDDDFISVDSAEQLISTMSNIDATLGIRAFAAGIREVYGTTGNDILTVDAGHTGPLEIFLDGETHVRGNGGIGGDEMINASTTAAMITVNAVGGGDINASDMISGGNTATDVFNISVSDDQGATTMTDLTGVTGFETLNIEELVNMPGTSGDGVDSNSTETVYLGMGGASGDFGTIVETGFESGDTLNIDGTDFGAAVNYDGSGSSASGSIMTDDAGDFDDAIMAGGGNDSVETYEGDDTIDAGAGADWVDGGLGRDSIDGGTGGDYLMGGAGAYSDTINGGSGDDTITGGGDDEFPTTTSNPTPTGDVLTGGAGADSFRIVNVSDSSGASHDLITDFVAGVDEICIEETALQGAGGAASSLNFIGITANFAQAQGAIGATGGNGIADWVLQLDNAVEETTIWIDVNDDGVLNANDIQIQLTDVNDIIFAGDIVLKDTVAPDAPTFVSVTDDTGASNSDFITNDDGTDATDPVVRVAFSNATDGTGAWVGDTLTLELPAGLNGGVDIERTLDATDIANGYYDFVVPVTGGDGTYTMSAYVTDEFGTIQDSSTTTQDLVIDTTATIDLDTVAGGDTDTAGIDYINAANAAAVTAAGTVSDVEDGQMVSVSFDDGVNPPVVVMAEVIAGSWSLSALEGNLADLSGLNDGDIDVTVSVTDVAGNVATDDAVTTDADPVHLDTTADIDITGIFSEPTTDDDIIQASEDSAGGWTIDGVVNDVEDGNIVTVEILGTNGTTVLHTFPGVALAGGAFTTAGAPADLFPADGTYFARATVTDDAGNPSTDTFAFVVDETGPVYTVDSVVYDETLGTIVVNGTFPVGDIAANGFDVTQADWVDDIGGAQAAQDIDFTETSGTPGPDNFPGTATQLTLTWDAGRQAFHESLATVGGPGEDTLVLNQGILVDDLGNESLASGPLTITLHISTAVQGVASITGWGGDDILTANNATGDSLTGGDGADTFNIDVISLGAGSADGAPVDGGTTDAFITDFDSSEGDMIMFNASDLNGLDPALAGVFAAGIGDGSTVAFRTFTENGNAPNDNTDAVAATTLAGTIIWDEVNNLLRIDVSGDTSFNGFVVNDPNADDVIIDMTGITGSVSASDIGFF